MARSRLAEASATGAPTMVTVCHYCNQLFASLQDNKTPKIENYISLLAAALGIEREDTFRKYRRWADPDRVLADAASLVAGSPYPREFIRRAVAAVFGA
jgi:hypothetical protein